MRGSCARAARVRASARVCFTAALVAAFLTALRGASSATGSVASALGGSARGGLEWARSAGCGFGAGGFGEELTGGAAAGVDAVGAGVDAVGAGVKEGGGLG